LSVLEQGVEHALVAIRRLDEDLRAPELARLVLERAQRSIALAFTHRQVAVEGKALAVWAAGAHQSEQDRRRTDQRRDANSQSMRARHQAGTGIGHRRAAGVRHQADVLAV